jgi:hypothetical protein
MRRRPRRAHRTRMITYSDASSVTEARAAYFAANGFSEAGYRDRWVRLKLGPVPVAFPNTRSRQRAVPLHDLHHVATGYATTLVGEAEIGAWELAGGCTDHWAAWVLDAGSFAYGLVLAPRRIWRAFLRGRHGRTLYHDGWSDALLDLRVGELRARLGLNGPPPVATWRDRAAFAGWIAVVAAPGLAALALAYAFLQAGA